MLQQQLERERQQADAEGETIVVQSPAQSANARPQRSRHPPVRYQNEYAHVAIVDIKEPRNLQEAMESPNREAWKESLLRELTSMQKHCVWRKATMEELATASNVVDSKLVLKHKHDVHGRLVLLKSRLVARGFSQVSGIDYDEVFAPTAKVTTVRLLLALAAYFDLEVEQMDVVTAFLCGKLRERIFMKLPDIPMDLARQLDFEPGEVALLLRMLYSLKQSPREWYNVFATKLQELGFMRSPHDYALFFREGIALVVYVDDLLIFSQSRERVQELKQELFRAFDMKDMGPARFFLGMEVIRDRSKRILKICQQAYIDKMLEIFGQVDAKDAATPMETGGIPIVNDHGELLQDMMEYQALIGSLLYAARMTRPDISYAVSTLAQYNAEPTRTHLKMALRVLRYLKKTREQGICYGNHGNMEIIAYSDADWAGCKNTRKSTTGYVVVENLKR